MANLAFRDKVRHYRQLAGFSQEVLAREIGLHPCVLSRKLHARSTAYLTAPEIKKLILTLAVRGVLTSREQVVELLALGELGPGVFRPGEWCAPPLSELGERPPDAADTVVVLLRDGVRLVTLTGGVGAGKTSTALRVGRLVRGSGFAEPVPVDLRSVSDAARLRAAIADTGALAGRGPVLLILDGGEHLTAVRPVATELLAAHPALAILLTSCCPLLVLGREVPLPG